MLGQEQQDQWQRGCHTVWGSSERGLGLIMVAEDSCRKAAAGWQMLWAWAWSENCSPPLIPPMSGQPQVSPPAWPGVQKLQLYRMPPAPACCHLLLLLTKSNQEPRITEGVSHVPTIPSGWAEESYQLAAIVFLFFCSVGLELSSYCLCSWAALLLILV
jgi:hypothetical protein